MHVKKFIVFINLETKKKRFTDSRLTNSTLLPAPDFIDPYCFAGTEALSTMHGCWCPGYLWHKAINSYAIQYVI